MNQKAKYFVFFFIGAFTTMLLMFFFNNKVENKNPVSATQPSTSVATHLSENKSKSASTESASGNIEDLTGEEVVIDYVKKNGRLPGYYLTKNEAKKRGWNPSEGNLCEVLPGRAIGGDPFANREKKLPKGTRYYEADVNYSCGNRNADRIVFDEKGDVWLSHDHYRTFEKK